MGKSRNSNKHQQHQFHEYQTPSTSGSGSFLTVKHQKYHCSNPNCTKVFSWKTSLTRHMLECDKRPEYRCPYCDYKSRDKNDVRNHTGYQHPEQENYVIEMNRPLKAEIYICPNDNCKRSYKAKRSLWAHLNYECGKEPRYKCAYCTYRTFYKCNLKHHARNNHPDQEYREIDTQEQSNTDESVAMLEYFDEKMNMFQKN